MAPPRSSRVIYDLGDDTLAVVDSGTCRPLAFRGYHVPEADLELVSGRPKVGVYSFACITALRPDPEGFARLAAYGPYLGTAKPFQLRIPAWVADYLKRNRLTELEVVGER